MLDFKYQWLRMMVYRSHGDHLESTHPRYHNGMGAWDRERGGHLAPSTQDLLVRDCQPDIDTDAGFANK